MDSTTPAARPPHGPLRRLASSLKTRIALVAGLLALVAVAAATRVTVGTFADEAERHGVAQQRDAAQRSAQRLAERIEERMRLLEALAAAVPPEVHRSTEAALAFLARVAPAVHGVRTLSIVGPDARVIARLIDGRALAFDTDLSDRAHVQRALETRRPAVSSAIRARADGRPSLALAHPVGDPDTPPRGLILATLALEGTGAVGEIAVRTHPETRTIVVDRELRVVGHVDSRHVLGPASRLPELEAPLRAIGARIRGNDLNGGGRFGDDVVGWASVDGTDWLVFELQEANALLAGARAAERQATDASLALGAAAAAAMFAACLALMRPVDRLRERALGAVDAAARLDVGWPDGSDEVGELSRAFRRALVARAEAEAAQAGAHARVAAIVEHLEVGVALTRYRRFERVNPALCRMLGYGRDELVGRPTSSICLDEAQYERLLATTLEAMARDGRFDIEMPVRRRDGATITLRTIGSLLVPGDVQAGMLWSVEDVTMRRAELEQLALSREIIDRAHEAIVVTDDGDDVILANPAFLEMSRRTREDVIGRGAAAVGLEPLPADLGAMDARGAETALARPDGSTVPCWTSIVRLERTGVRTLHLRMLADIGRLKEAQRELQRLALHDALTSLPNRAGFRVRLADACARAGAAGGVFTLLFVDLDGFKAVNDRFGHDGGDELLRQAAARLQRAVRATDTVCRLGGDEFTVIAEGAATPGEVERLCARLLAALSPAFELDGRAATIGASIGACAFPAGAATPDALVTRADAAMYEAKRAGKGTWRLHRPDAGASSAPVEAVAAAGDVGPAAPGRRA